MSGGKRRGTKKNICFPIKLSHPFLAKGESDEAGLSKEQDAVARYVRFNCPTNASMFEGNEVHYFTASKAIDTLMESKYGSKAKGEPLFSTRQSALFYMRDLHGHQLFFRARKLVPKKKDNKKEIGSGDAAKSKKDGKGKKNKEEETVTETEAENKDDEKVKKDSDEKEDDKKNKKKKTKLEYHDTQVFNDDKDVFVWVFDPTPFYKKVIGLCMVLGTIVGCLFPLWPMWLRQGVYYVSLAGVGLFGFIVVVAILRSILFGVIWLATMGQHKLWILPNLTEDCGFFESFKPWYTYEHCPRGQSQNDKNKKKDKKQKDKNSDDEQEQEKEKETTAGAEVNEDGRIDDEGSQASDGDEGSAVSDTDDIPSSAPPSPEETAPRKRRPKKDGDFVIVQ